MEAQVSTSQAIEKAKGKKDNAGQPASLKFKPLKDCFKDGVKLRRQELGIKDTYADWCKAMADKTGLPTSDVRKLINSAVDDNFEDVKEKAETRALAFYELSDVAAAAK